MHPYETSATIEGAGQLHVEGVPFPAGTLVDVTISPQRPVTGERSVAGERLLAELDKARNVVPIGALRRDELYDRTDFH
jgi:hypothetical protein